MSEIFTPLLTSTDWGEEWMNLQEAQHKFDDPSTWDKRAKSFDTKHGSHSSYVERFIELAQILPGETVFDMGCGSGALANPLALAGHKVIACDFSSGMLKALNAEKEALGITNITPIQMSWQDDWTSFGLSNKCVDVALASRSIATNDLKKALQKLTDITRRRVCITLAAGSTPKVDNELMKAAGLEPYAGRSFVYAFNILIQMDYLPEVEYIPSLRVDTFTSFDDALQLYTKLVEHAAVGVAPEEKLAAIPEHLTTWLKEHLVKVDDHYELDHARKVIWAFIAWDRED